ncbi:MAG: hypothetical protein AAFP69_00135 [Planctomycetota bacterium]
MFVLRVNNSAQTMGFLLGGVIGALIAQAMANHKANKKPEPPFMQDPLLQNIDAKTRKRIRTTEFLAMFSLDANLDFKKTFLGFQFMPTPDNVITFQGFFHKGKIGRYMEKCGLRV